jgi:RNA polymerase sigma factor (sigma-70 family)
MTNSAAEEILSTDDGRVTRLRTATQPARDELIDTLFRRHYTGLLRLAVVMLGDREAAEDAVQDAFASLHRNWRALREPDVAESYLRSTVLNRCRSWIRRQVTQRAARPLMLVRQHQQSAEDTIVDRDEAVSLVTVMRTLPRRQREVLACRYVLELSVEETARVLSISEGSVKTHSHRGLKALEQRIEVAR